MKKRAALILLLLLGLSIYPAFAQEAIPDELLHEALLSDRYYRKDVEYLVEGHQILGTSRDGNRVEVYLSASVGGYGFMGGSFLLQCGWGGACTAFRG